MELRNCLLLTLQAIFAITCIYLFMQTQFQLSWVVSYIHVCTNEAHSLADMQGLISTLAGIIISNTKHQK